MKMRRSTLVRIVAVFVSAALAVPGTMPFAVAQEPAEATDSRPTEIEPRRIAVVTHPDNPVDELTKAELGRLFLKKRTFWATGERCVPIDQPGSSDIRERFYREALELDQTELKRYWMQETMTGNARPPVTVDNAAVVKKYIEKLSGAVAYIWADEVDDSVKVIRVRDVPAFADPEAFKEAPEDSAPSP